jgi:cytochrome c553
MPPKKPRLSDTIVADLTKWVQMGAPDPREGTVTRDKDDRWEAEFQHRLDWWSLRRVTDVTLPKVAGQWPRGAVDRFVLSQLKRRQLHPAADADALTLLRRLSFVLTGLPPAPDLVKTFPAHFEKDPDAALAAVVDDLLKSPAFGERIARHWMDVVRYTDTYGYEWDNPAKGSWEYRDYLIRTFNSDVGFDQVIREQIAGDLLAAPRVDRASGFNECLIGPMFYHLGEHRHGDNEILNGVREEMIDNKIDASSKAFLAMTVACARCHDHKLDAISQKDYYALAGMFMTPRWTSRSIEATEKNAAKIGELRGLRSAVRERMAKLWGRRASELAAGEPLRQAAAKLDRAELAKAKLGEIEWLLHQLLPRSANTEWRESKRPVANAAEKGTKLVVQEDGSILATGEGAETDAYSVTFRTEPGAVDRIRLEALTHDTLGKRGPGRTPHGNFVLSHIRVSVKPFFAANDSKEKVAQSEPRQVDLAAARADYEQPNYPVADAIHPADSKGWGVGLGGNVDRTACFTFAKPIELPHGGEWTVTLEHRYGSRHSLGRFRITAGFETPLTQSEIEGLASDEATTSAWQRLATEWRATSRQRRESNAKFKPLTEFALPNLPHGFVIDGDGMRTGYTAGGEPLIALAGDLAVERLLPRGYHTHALSSKLPGALRLPSQEVLPGPFVSVALAGDEWSGYLRISDNGFQTENVTFLSQRHATWRTLGNISPTNGIQRVAYEIATSDLNPNFPPRTGVARVGGKTLPPQDEGFDKRSWFSLTGIVSHDQSGQPMDDLRRFERLFADPPPASTREAWRRVGGWLANSVANCKVGPASSEDVQLVNWLLGRGLLSNRLAEDSELAGLVKRYRDVEASLPFARTCNSMDERGVTSLNYALNIRGDITRRGDRVPRGLPRFVGAFGTPPSIVNPTDGPRSGRLELAEFLADPRHGLAARVYVNRVWQWVFGDGLVRTSNDFGHLGEQPSHPELLDYLAREFIADGWSTKRLIRRLVLSRTFRQSGKVSAQAAAVDPFNRWLHHYPTRRLEAEAIRDALLAVSGRLDRTLYGRPIKPQRQVEDAAKRLFSGPLDGNGRRSIYLEVSIMDRSKFLQSFNAPDPKLPTGRRDDTNVPAQALVMLNDPLVLAMADHWSSRLVADGSPSVESRIESMFVQALGRPPEKKELARWATLIGSLSTDDNVLKDRDPWKHAVHTMFNLQEFTHYR